MPCRSQSVAQALEEAVRGDNVAALALDRLDEDRRHLARRHVALEEDVLDVVEHRLALIGAGEERPIGVRDRARG